MSEPTFDCSNGVTNWIDVRFLITPAGGMKRFYHIEIREHIEPGIRRFATTFAGVAEDTESSAAL